MTHKAPTAEQSFLIQSHALLESIVNLSEIERTKGGQFFIDNNIYGQTAKKINNAPPAAIIKNPIFGGQGSILSCFYLFLVLPQEWNANPHNPINIDLTQAETVAAKCVRSQDKPYNKDSSVLKHLRNALAHGRVEWNDGEFMFRDEQGDKKYCGIMSMECLGRIAQELNLAIRNYIIKCGNDSS